MNKLGYVSREEFDELRKENLRQVGEIISLTTPVKIKKRKYVKSGKYAKKQK